VCFELDFPFSIVHSLLFVDPFGKMNFLLAVLLFFNYYLKLK